MKSFSHLRIKLYRLTRYSFAVPLSKKLRGIGRFLEADDYIIRMCTVEELKEMIENKVLVDEQVLIVIPVYDRGEDYEQG